MDESSVTVGEAPGGYATFAASPGFGTLAKPTPTLAPGESGLEGYLAPTYVLADRGLFFVKGAFTKTIQERLDTAHHLFDHWPDQIAGRHVSAAEDAKGLRVAVKLNEEKQLGRDLMSDYRFGIGYGWSIGFDAVKDRSGDEKDDAKLDRSGAPHLANVPITELRAVTEARWWEGSTVPWGAIHSARPDIVQSRIAAPALSALLAAVRAGTLTPEQDAAITELIAAREARAGAGLGHSTPDVPAPRPYAAELDLLFLELGIPIEVAA
jgi:HK97 family phage prohead protease